MKENDIKFIIAVLIQIALLIISFLVLCMQYLPFYQSIVKPATLIIFLTQVNLFAIWGWITIFKRKTNYKAIIKNEEVYEIKKTGGK